MRKYATSLLLIPFLALGSCEKRKPGVIYHTPGDYKVETPERSANELFNELQVVAPFLKRLYNTDITAELTRDNSSNVHNKYRDYYRLSGSLTFESDANGIVKHMNGISYGRLEASRNAAGYAKWTFTFDEPIYIMPSDEPIKLAAFTGPKVLSVKSYGLKSDSTMSGSFVVSRSLYYFPEPVKGGGFLEEITLNAQTSSTDLLNCRLGIMVGDSSHPKMAFVVRN